MTDCMEEQNNINCKYLTINFIKREKGNIFSSAISKPRK